MTRRPARASESASPRAWREEQQLARQDSAHPAAASACPPKERFVLQAGSITAGEMKCQPGFRSHSGSKPHNEPEGAVEVAARALPDDPQAQAARQIAHKALMRSPGDGGPRQMPTRDLKRHDFPPAPRRATPPARGSAKEAWRSTGARLGNLRAVTARPWAMAPYWPS